MNTIGADTFTEVVANGLERMAFVFSEPAIETPGEILAQSIAHAIVSATGVTCWNLCVSATPGMVGEVASGMLGLDVEDLEVDEHASAVVGELANILGGELIMQMTDGEEGMTLSLPRDANDDEAGALLDGSRQSGFCVALGTETGQLLVAVRFG